MAHQEKRVWIMLIVSVAAYGFYVSTILGRTNGGPLTSVPYASTLLWTIIGAIVVSIVAEIAVSTVNPRASRVRDVRDKEIHRLGDYVGQSFIIVGATAAMLMAMADWDRFWIANVIYLCFVLSAVLGSITKIVLYRRSLPQW